MKHYTTNKRYCPHEITTKLNSVQLYRQTGDISYVCRKYKISKASLMRWNKAYDGTKESLMPKSHHPHSPHPNAHTEQEIKWIKDYHRRNPNISLGELYGKLREDKAYSRHPGSLYRVFVRLGFRKKVESTKKKLCTPCTLIFFDQRTWFSELFSYSFPHSIPHASKALQPPMIGTLISTEVNPVEVLTLSASRTAVEATAITSRKERRRVYALRGRSRNGRTTCGGRYSRSSSSMDTPSAHGRYSRGRSSSSTNRAKWFPSGRDKFRSHLETALSDIPKCAASAACVHCRSLLFSAIHSPKDFSCIKNHPPLNRSIGQEVGGLFILSISSRRRYRSSR